MTQEQLDNKIHKLIVKAIINKSKDKYPILDNSDGELTHIQHMRRDAFIAGAMYMLNKEH